MCHIGIENSSECCILRTSVAQKGIKHVTEAVSYVSHIYWLTYMFTLHVILSHALGATSSITERSSVILSVSEESVTDASLRSA